MRRAPLSRPRAQEAAEPLSAEEQSLARFALLDAIGKVIAGHRKEAVDGRAASGIERIWVEDEEHYEGIDDLNRGSMTAPSQTKPPGQRMPAVSASQSIEFPNITRPYVDAAAAKVGDILLPTDDRAWSLKETPIPELIEKAKGVLPLEVIEGLAAMNATEQQALQVQGEEAKAAQALIDAAKDKAKRAQKRIEDWHVEGQFHAEMREVIDDATKVGTGVLKGPLPIKKKAQMYRDEKLVIDEQVKPVSKRVDPWNCFPDPSCGRSIHNGRYFFERDYLTPKQLELLKGGPDYIEEQINLCLAEGPKKGDTTGRRTSDGRNLDDDTVFEVWYFYGYATKEELEAAAGAPSKEGTPPQVPIVFTLVNDRVIKGALNHIDTGEFPYDFFPWQRKKNSPWGTGVARQIRCPQRIVTASTRVMLTNAGRAAGPIFIMQNHVKGANGKNDIEPWKLYYAGPSDTTDDAAKSMAMIKIPILQPELMAIIEYGLKLAEDVTGLPLLLQGQAGSAPETLGGQQLVDRNASGVLRRIARTVDDTITEPHIRRYYSYLLIYGEEDIEKGEFVLDARGSTALVEREINRQEVTALLEAALNPKFGLDPKKTMAEKLRADNRNPKDFQFSEEQQKALDQAAQQPPQDPRAVASKEVATIRSTADIEKAKLVQTSDMAELNFKAKEAERQRRHEMAMRAIDERMEIMKLAGAQNISVSEIKAQLAGTVMKLRMQDKLSKDKNASSPQVASPGVEPRGRAAPGKAFEQ